MSALLNHRVNALLQARCQSTKIDPDEYPLDRIDDGYDIQHELMKQYCEQKKTYQTGWKIAFTGTMAQQKYGISEPVYGHLLEDMCFKQTTSFQLKADDAVKLEVELVFILAEDLDPEKTYTEEQLLHTVGQIVPALEIVNVRWKHWNFQLGQFLADNAAAQAYVLGEPIAYNFDHKGLENLIENCNFQFEIATTHTDYPRANYLWLVRYLLGKGQKLTAGQHILTGSLIRPVNVSTGQYNVQIAGQNLKLFVE